LTLKLTPHQLEAKHPHPPAYSITEHAAVSDQLKFFINLLDLGFNKCCINDLMYYYFQVAPTSLGLLIPVGPVI
jgi:hypothetical protein